MEEDKQKNSDDGKMTAFRATIIIVLAVIFDAAQIILSFVAGSIVASTIVETLGITGIMIAVGVVLDWLVSIFAWLTFYILFKMWGFSGWGLGGGSSIIESLALAFGFEMIPLADTAPGWTVWAIYTAAEGLAKRAVEKVPGGETLANIAEVI